MIAQFSVLFFINFHTNKGTERKKKPKSAIRDRYRILFVQFGWVTNLKSPENDKKMNVISQV